jgi:hypothetical protein
VLATHDRGFARLGGGAITRELLYEKMKRFGIE